MAKVKNSFGIPYLTQGPSGLVAILNSITAALDSVRVQRSVDMDSLVTPEGTLLTIRNPTATTRKSAAMALPFQLTNASTVEGVVTTLKVSIHQGTVNGVYPTGMNATTPKEFTITDTTEFWLKVVGTFGAPDTYVVTIETTSDDEVITGTGFVSYWMIGSATVASGAIVSPLGQNVFGNMWVESLGSANQWW